MNLLSSLLKFTATQIARLDGRVDDVVSAATVDSEVIDIRNGLDGTHYPSAGAAVRGQCIQLLKTITSLNSRRLSEIRTLQTHKVAQPLDGNNQPTDGTSGQTLRTNGDGTTEWASVGLPTDAQTAEAVSEWLDEHPEATTTVLDASLTPDKFTLATKKKVINATRNALIGFITPSYGSSAFYPNTYALGISYDGVTFNQIQGTEQCAGDFRGGGDAIITKVGDYYICIVNSDLDNLQPDSLNKAIQYVVTKDFKTFSEVKYFTAYNIGTYLMDTYDVTEDFASRKQWEPSLFFDNSGNLFLTVSGGYKADESYPNDCYYYGSSTVFIRYFKQLYMPVVFDEDTETLVAASGGTIKEFKFPSGVESVIDAQIVPNGEGYYYLYKDRVTCACNIAEMDTLDATPIDVVECLYGASFSENPYMVSFGDYRLIYVTHYLMDGTSRDGKVICAKNDLSKFEAMRYAVNGDIMADGTKNRSLHPIVMDDADILNYFENECGVCNGTIFHSSSSNLNPQNLVDQLAIYYGLPQTLSSEATYLVPTDCSIIVDTRWTHDYRPILLKRWKTSQDVNVSLRVYGKQITNTVKLSRNGYLTLYAAGTEQTVLLQTPPLSNQWTFERNEVKCEFWRSDIDEVLYYKITGNNTSARNAGATVELNANTGNIPSILPFDVILNAVVGDAPMFIKLDVANNKLRFVYPNGSSAGAKYVGNGVIITSTWS